jgi:hypothetical protein
MHIRRDKNVALSAKEIMIESTYFQELCMIENKSNRSSKDEYSLRK